ncbi:fungal-specific transcription factor domain-domain-containing protein [Clohesyomyces aquaticus]|uniref:Fungal-specific transcription factor domain-domain-containing protein n=1 Tax=Clohesyomyces aquaticus TaxID=1231657 RepID=A0A1Y1Y636_9PLEO|nr:fungal-specific transcription factor domain-domain-containing protein [Clohesyomyces aquaticus]
MEKKQAKRNCWTCKERKVGCDRVLPTCSNCRRTNRCCQGYAIKLSWPDKQDGRRKQKNYDGSSKNLSSKNYVQHAGNFYFLNTNFNDLVGKRMKLQDMNEGENFRALTILTPVSPFPDIRDEDGMLLSYYDSVLARMVTTVDDNTNGFRLDLIPMALSSSDPTSKSLLEATLALSSFHLGRPEVALRHKVRAIKSLSESIETSTSAKLTQLGACMMLCVYSVFDPSDFTWNVHLQGAKMIMESLSECERGAPSFKFLAPWVEYHDALSGYSYSSNLSSHQNEKPLILPESDDDDCKVIGLLGCSMELLRLISCINQVRHMNDALTPHPPPFDHEVVQFCTLIRTRLQNLQQEVYILASKFMGTINRESVSTTAQFYRAAALLYLHQVMPGQSGADTEIRKLVEDGFALVRSMEVCTSPWPMFILACSVSSDAERLQALAILDAMDEKRRIGNVQIIKAIVKAVWKQQDLALNKKNPPQIDWRTLIDADTSMPSFI